MFLDKSAENAIFARVKESSGWDIFFHSGLCLFNLTSVR